MANRWFNQFKGSLEPGLVTLPGYLSLSAAGAVLNSTTAIQGAVITKTGTGQYTIQLKDRYPYIVGVSLTPCSLATSANQVWKVRVVQDAASVTSVTEPGAAGLKKVSKIIIESCTSAGAPADVAVAGGLFINLTLKNTTVK